ncbi:ETC complex I subunit-like protein [Hasllibacter halocynthiae]|uniref:ETC complex I subunit-like protein n=1 Tax=Hasllibacter halocynthiae TaxID=595589 RepID=A0A2T0X1Y4_9RHOB|nr:ETC complex I subunit [Hasllibacter halocynthiae]PRY92948.1 ETC complex I subunit-like protein [Hasllibacter halocynthiae]
MRARLYQPAKTAMSSGQARTRGWVLEFVPQTAREVDPLMGWTSSRDTQAQVRMSFDTREAAEGYAEAHGVELVAKDPRRRAPNVRAGGYGENFATGRRGSWTH